MLTVLKNRRTNKLLATLVLLLTTSCLLFAQDLHVRTFESYFYHSNYSLLGQGVSKEHFFLSKKDDDYLRNSDSLSMEVIDSIYARYEPFGFENGIHYKIYSPYDIYALLIEKDTFQFIQPIASYSIDKDKFTSIDLIQLVEKSQWQILQEAEMLLFSKKEFKECIKLDLPASIDVKSDQFLRVDEVWIVVKNKFKETMEMRFKLR